MEEEILKARQIQMPEEGWDMLSYILKEDHVIVGKRVA